jgi:TP901 family phage tail tape measure protein
MAEKDFEQLLATIEKINSQIGTLSGKIESIQKEMTSGHWGTQQLREFRTELEKLTQQFTQKKVRLESLVNERDLIESTRGFDSLAKSIESTRRQLQHLQSEKTSRAAGQPKFLDYSSEQLEKEIAKYERALNSFESRMRSRYTAQGTRRTGKEVDPLAAGEGNVGDLTSRLGPPRLSPKEISSIKEKGRQAAQTIIQQLQNELLQGAIAARLTPGNLPEINAQQNEILRAAIRDKEAISSRAERIRAINAEYDAGDIPTSPGVTTIGEPRSRLSFEERELNKTNLNISAQRAASEAKEGWGRIFAAIEAEARAQLRGGRLSEGEGAIGRIAQARAGIHPPGWRRGAEGGWERIPSQDDLSSQVDRAKQAQDRLLNTLRGRIASEEKYKQALDQAARQGFNINDLKRVQTQGTAGRERLQFDRVDESGINRRFDTYVSPSGRASPGISNQFRSFGQGIARDIGELTKWSIALAAVYGPMRKLQELTQIMIENQTRLAEAATSVSSAFIGQDEIFNAAAEAAQRAGESIDGVIDAFTLAYRAAGGGSSEMERFATATELLDNALILSKLSSLDQATAIDTLAAAMRQTSGELTGSIELLDSWVRVTKIANVDLASLATGFAVLGDAAEAAQINSDELNGILATIGETGVASGRELANTARAIVAGFQSDQAREALEQIGVAVEDTTGKARPFLEVMQELSNLRQTGALDETSFSKLTLALGGGTRRQAAYATFIENFSRVREVAQESANASGDAQAALAKQLETVQTSLTRLGNAFQELAQAMGTEGGFLDIITLSVDGMTGLVKILDDLTGLLGKATPAMLAFVAAAGVLKYRGQGGIQTALGNLGAGIQRDPELLRLAQYGGGNIGAVPAQGRFGQIGQSLLGSTGIGAGGLQGLLVSAIPAILNFTNKEDRYGKTKGGADLIGGLAGGILGAFTPLGPVIGAMIGTAIAETFVNATIARRTDIFGYQAPELGPKTAGTDSVSDLDAALKEAEINLYKSIGGGNESLGKFLSSGATKTAESLVDRVNAAIKEQDPEALSRIFEGKFGEANKKLLTNIGLSPQTIEQAFKGGQQIEFKPEYVAFTQASKEAQEQFRAAESARAARGGTPLDESTAFSAAVDANRTAFEPLLKRLEEASRNQLRTDRVEGDVRGAEYGRRTSALEGFDTKALQYYTALGDQVDRLTGGAEDASTAFDVLNNVIVFGSEDALPQLTALEGEIQNIINLLSDPKLNADALGDLGGVDAAEELLRQKQEDFADLLADANQQALLSQLKIPGVEGDINKPLSQGDFGLVQERAKSLQDEFYQGFLQIPDDMYDALKDSWEEWAQIVEDSGDVFFEKVSEIDPQFFQQAMQQLLEENKLKSQEQNPFGIQQVDLESSRLGELQGLISYFTNYLSTNFPQYQQNPEDVGVIFNDYVTAVLHGDNLAIKLALEKLVDLNQKQLDGMYNIPEGATFWVPLTAAYYKPKNEGGGLPGGNIEGVPENTTATERNTTAVQNMTTALQNRKEDMVEQWQSRHFGEGLTRGQQADAARLQGLANKYNQEKSREAEAARYTGLAGLYGYNPDKTGQLTKDTSELPEVSLITQLFQSLQTWLQGMMAPQPPLAGRANMRADTVGDAGGGYRGFTSQAAAAQVNPQVNARLELQLENTTQLVVDGRILASVLSPYLAQEMIRLESAQGTITRRYVI